MLGELKKFDGNFTIELDEIGFFYIYCLLSGENATKVYENVITVLPKNLTRMTQDRLKYKQTVADFKANLNISIFNSTFNDNDLMKCCKKIDLANQDAVKMSVLILGIDSLSFNHFRRVLPLTFNYLNNDMSEENIVYDNFNSVGQSTHPNIVAAMAGIIDNKIFNLTSEMGVYRKLDSTFHDHLPFIWNSYEDLG